MNCEQVRPALLEHLFEEASAEERAAIERHLEGCARCSQEMAELKQTMSLLVRGEASEEIPRRIRIVTEPAGPRWTFWLAPARLAFAGAGLLFLAIALLALFRTTISYQNGNFQIAFGAPAVSSGAPVFGAAPQVARALDRVQVDQMIADASAAFQAEQQRQSGLLAKEVAQQMEQRWQHDLQEMAASVRYFQSAQTMMWKEQQQNQQLVSSLMRQAGMSAPGQQ